jgi:hypothetical protein
MNHYRIQQGIFVWHVEASTPADALAILAGRSEEKYEVRPDRNLTIEVRKLAWTN